MAGTPGVTLAGSTTTDEAGDFSFTTASGLERVSSFWAEALGARSPRTRVVVSAAAVTLSGPAPAGSQLPLTTRRARLAGTATELAFHGTVAPAMPGARVILQRQSRRRADVWRPIAHGLVQPDGTYTLLHAFSVAGPATLRVVVRTRGVHATVSEPLSYQIAPAVRRTRPASPPRRPRSRHRHALIPAPGGRSWIVPSGASAGRRTGARAASPARVAAAAGPPARGHGARG